MTEDFEKFDELVFQTSNFSKSFRHQTLKSKLLKTFRLLQRKEKLQNGKEKPKCIVKQKRNLNRRFVGKRFFGMTRNAVRLSHPKRCAVVSPETLFGCLTRNAVRLSHPKRCSAVSPETLFGCLTRNVIVACSRILQFYGSQRAGWAGVAKPNELNLGMMLERLKHQPLLHATWHMHSREVNPSHVNSNHVWQALRKHHTARLQFHVLWRHIYTLLHIAYYI